MQSTQNIIMPIRPQKMLTFIIITATIVIITLTLIKVLKDRNGQAQWCAPIIPPRVEASLGNLGRSYLKIKTLKGGCGGAAKHVEVLG